MPGLEQELEQRVQNAHAHLTSSGRGALFQALEAAGIGEGDEVLLQAFTCLAVPAAIMWAGATPVYVDINHDSLNLDPAELKAKITPRTRAIIIQHTFGIPAPLKDILPITREHKLLVIEDIAHALGATYHGQPVGSFGDVAILSFGRDKTISSVFGGAAITRTIAIPAAPPPSNLWAVQQLLHPLIMNALLPVYFTAHIGKVLLLVAQRLGLLSIAVTREEKTAGAKPYFADRGFHPALAPLLHTQLGQLDEFTQRRRNIAKRYLKEIKSPAYLHEVAASANWLRFPVWVKDKKAVLAAAKHERMLLGDWYPTPVTPTTLDQQDITHYQPGSCLEAERAAKHVINLPTHPRMTDDDVTRVIEFIKKYD
jgi:dTDP-4-amino-4,6-dideoxygalactose transaminase